MVVGVNLCEFPVCGAHRCDGVFRCEILKIALQVKDIRVVRVYLQQAGGTDEHSLDVLWHLSFAQNDSIAYAVSQSSKCLLVIHSANRAMQHNVERLRPIFATLFVYGVDVAILALEALETEFCVDFKLRESSTRGEITSTAEVRSSGLQTV